MLSFARSAGVGRGCTVIVAILRAVPGSKLHKLVWFVPESSLDTTREAVFAAGAGRIGEYERCSWYAAGTGTFRAGEGADPTIGEVVCSTENTLDVFTRKSGKQTFTNVTNELTSAMVSLDGGLTYQRVALFSGGLQDFYWQYANKGLRLLQLRFYQQ